MSLPSVTLKARATASREARTAAMLTSCSFLA
jgi:hypothetical protein